MVWVPHLHWPFIFRSFLAIGKKTQRHRKLKPKASAINYLILSPHEQRLPFSSLYFFSMFSRLTVKWVNNKCPKTPTMQNDPQFQAGSSLCQQISTAGFWRLCVTNDTSLHLNLVLEWLWSRLGLWRGNLMHWDSCLEKHSWVTVWLRTDSHS